jgi:diguanylate cyclase (GGDEF)-like protein
MESVLHLSSATRFPDLDEGRLARSRLRRRRRQRLQMLKLAGASYAIDTLLMVALALAGALPLTLALAYGAAGAGVCGLMHLLLASGWSERFEDHYLVAPQMALNTLVNVAFLLAAPQVGVLLLMVQFVIFAFGALRMSMRQVVVMSTLIAVALGGVMVQAGDQLALPSATLVQRLLSGLWFGLVLARSALLGLYGAQLRGLLARRNAELASTSKRLERLASRDDLTGALSRRRIMAALAEARAHTDQGGACFGVALLDIDHFKQVNDRHGHPAGDEVLRRFVRIANAGGLRSSDRLGRYGGEEFLLLLRSAADESSALAATDRLRRIIAKSPWAEIAPGLAVTVSGGVAMYAGEESIEQLLSRADKALYQAKQAGRDRIHVG